MALLSDNAEAAGLDLAFASALVSFAWAGGQVVGGSAFVGFAEATTDAARLRCDRRGRSRSLSRRCSPVGGCASRRPPCPTDARGVRDPVRVRARACRRTARKPRTHPRRSDGSGLRRAITPTLLLIFIVGDILGGGIYALVGEVGAETGGAIWSAFILALIMAAFTAGSYAELVSKYPHAGGAALYVNRAFKNRFLSFIVAFAVVASGITSASALARGFGGDYLSEFVDLKVVLGALALLALITIVNLRGISESVKLNVGFTIVEVVRAAADRADRRRRDLPGRRRHRSGLRVQGGHQRVRRGARRRRARLLCPGRLRGLGQRRRGDAETRAARTPRPCSSGSGSPASSTSWSPSAPPPWSRPAT